MSGSLWCDSIKMMSWACLFVWQLSWVAGHGLSYDLYHTLSKQWITHPEPDDAYFGFSVTYEPTSKRLIISAPQHDDIGEVYSCELDSNNCNSVKKHHKLTTKSEKRTDSHKSWFGATVKAGPSFFLTCAPRHLERRRFGKKNDLGTFSLCFKYENLTHNASPTTIKSFTDAQRRGPRINLYEQIMDSLGWSIDVSGNETLIGGPAMYTGRVLKPTDESHEPIHLSGHVIGAARKVSYNFGYSVLMGHFYKSKEDSVIYAISSPYGSSGYGMVLFFEAKDSRLFFKEELHDKVAVGSMFGAALCSARLDADSSLDWLLVGSPAYADTKEHHFNQGAVYIYEPKKPFKLFRKIVGKEDSMFGSAIVSLGDFNGDGMDEIVISAPYEDSGTGAVYLYSSKDIKNTDVSTVVPIQRITPEPLAVTPPVQVKSFGLSLATIQDYDENGCNELAIGAPESNRVMVLRCIAFTTVKLRDIPDLKKKTMMAGDDIKLSIESCLDFQYPEKPIIVTGRIRVNVELTLEDKKLEVKPHVFEIDLNRAQTTQCQDILVVAPKNGNYEFPIRYNITATDVEPAQVQKKFRASHVALSDLSILHATGALWFSDCADRNNCEPNLALTYSDTVGPEDFVIGSSPTIGLNTSVRNDGEVAYSACVRMSFKGTDVVVAPVGCERVPVLRGMPPTVVCRPDHSLRSTDEPWILPGLSLDTSQLTSRDKNLKIHMVVYNHCSKLDESKPTDRIITLKTDGRITIKGLTDSTDYDHYVNMTNADVDGKAFHHNYFITNMGVTNWVDLIAIVEVQNRSFIDYNSVLITGGANTCKNLSADNEEFIKYSCNIEKLFVNQEPVKLTIPMAIKYGALENIEKESRSQFSSITLYLDGTQITANETSQLNYQGGIAIWIILVAVLIGILTLLLFCFILSRCGFFKRNNKESLARVRQSVRRQTIMRRTMMEGVRASLDERALVASIPEETAEQAAARDRRVRLNSNAAAIKKPATRK